MINKEKSIDNFSNLMLNSNKDDRTRPAKPNLISRNKTKQDPSGNRIKCKQGLGLNLYSEQKVLEQLIAFPMTAVFSVSQAFVGFHC